MVCYWLLAVPVGALVAARLAPGGAARDTAAAASATADQDLEDELAATKAQRRRARLLLTRKVYHVLVLALFVPGGVWQLALLQLSLAAAAALFMLLEVVRALSIPPIAAPLSAFLARFLDSRDGTT